MKRKFIFIGGGLALLAVLLIAREAGVLRFEYFNSSTVTYAQPPRELRDVAARYAIGHVKIIDGHHNNLENPSQNVIDEFQVSEEGDALNIYFTRSAYDTSLGNFVPLYKNGTEVMFVHYEALREGYIVSSDAISLQREGTTKGFRTIRGMKAQCQEHFCELMQEQLRKGQEKREKGR